MSSFAHMAQALARNPWIPPRVKEGPETRGTSKTERIREYLRAHGWANSHTLAIEADVPQVALVGALLKNDLARGSVVREGDGYAWNPEYDETMHKQLAAAAALLKRHGWVVRKP